jgi:hypothetical protein
MANTELFVRRQPGGPFTIVDERMATGQVYFVNSTKATYGGDTVGKGRSPDRPFLTIDYAIGQATASQDDLILVDSCHAETVAAAITMDKIGLSIVGLGTGMNRPIITPNGAIDAVTMTAARSTLENVIFAGPLIDEQTADVNIAGQYCSLIDTYHIGSVGTENKVSIVTITAGGDDCLVDGIVIHNAVVELSGGGISLEGAATNVEIKNFQIYDEVGLALGAIFDAATATGVFIHDGIASNAKAATVVLEFGNNSEGSVNKVFINGRHTTIASNVTPGSGMAFFETYVVEEAQKSGLIQVAPAVDTD